MTRRDLLRLSGAAALTCLVGEAMKAAQLMTSLISAVDHLLLGASDLDQGIAWMEKLTGVRAVVGGSHPGVGTRNALLSLGGRRYLEIIAPDPAQTSYTSRFELRTLAGPRLITWAAAAPDIEELAKKVRGEGGQAVGPNDGSRARPDGKLLKWRTLSVPNELGREGIEPLPFFIQWSADSVHPSIDSPKGCDLRAFELRHPQPAAVEQALKRLGIDAKAVQSQTLRLAATLDTPNGSVTLG